MSTEHSGRQTLLGELPAALTANNFPEDVAHLYEYLLGGLRREAQARPGMTTLQLMTTERLVQAYCRLKVFDQQEKVYEPDLDKATRAFNTLVQRVLDAAPRDDDDETFRRLTTTALVQAVTGAVEDAVDNGEIDRSGASAFLARFEGRVTAAMD